MGEVETGWMIELQSNDGAKWWTAVEVDGLVFSRDPNKGVRFSRKEDAELVIQAMRDREEHQYWDEAYATDHMWCP